MEAVITVAAAHAQRTHRRLNDMMDNILNKAIDKTMIGIAACKEQDMVFLFEYCQDHIAQRIQFHIEETE